MPYLNLSGDDVASPTIALTDTKKKTADWNELAAKMSVFIGLLTLYTMVQQNWKGKR